MKRLRLNGIIALMLTALLLGVLLLVRASWTYRYVTDDLAVDHLIMRAGRHVLALQSHLLADRPAGTRELDQLVQAFHGGRSEIAWLRILDANGDVLAQSGDPPSPPVATEHLSALSEAHAPVFLGERRTATEDVFVVAAPFSCRLARGEPDRIGVSVADQDVRFDVAEVALYLEAGASPFPLLQRSLWVTMLAALALIGSMLAAIVRLPGYLRAKKLEHYLEVARGVQQRLLPRSCATCPPLDFVGECLPAMGVGGDYYDVLHTGETRRVIVLGDVSGKGLPAALLMTFLHGAVRAAYGYGNAEGVGQQMERLNGLLCAETADSHYASLFWADYDPSQSVLRYVNAGHVPPIIVNQGSNGSVTARRLRTGGPVVGLLPEARYEEGEIPVGAGDVLVVCSDGLVEASDGSGQEFGEDRLLRLVRDNAFRSANELHSEILRQVGIFVGGRGFNDDVTLLVARFSPLSIPAQDPAGPSRTAQEFDSIGRGPAMLAPDAAATGADVSRDSRAGGRWSSRRLRHSIVLAAWMAMALGGLASTTAAGPGSSEQTCFRPTRGCHSRAQVASAESSKKRAVTTGQSRDPDGESTKQTDTGRKPWKHWQLPPEGKAAVRFPSGDLFEAPVADPRQPRSHVTWQRYRTDFGTFDIASVAFGDSFGLIRWPRAREGDGLQVGLSGAVFAIFNLDAPSLDLLNADYVIGFPVSFRSGAWSARARIYHLSSHLGDEFLLNPQPSPPIERINLSYEAVELLGSRELGGVRVYGGGTRIFSSDGPLGRDIVHAGVDYRGKRGNRRAFSPFGGIDVRAWDETDWEPDISVKLGLAIGPTFETDSVLQLFVEYFNGRVPHGQFFMEVEVKYVSLGVEFSR